MNGTLWRETTQATSFVFRVSRSSGQAFGSMACESAGAFQAFACDSWRPTRTPHPDFGARSRGRAQLRTRGCRGGGRDCGEGAGRGGAPQFRGAPPGPQAAKASSISFRISDMRACVFSKDPIWRTSFKMRQRCDPMKITDDSSMRRCETQMRS